MLGKVAQMDGLRLTGLPEIAVDFLRDERGKRGGNLAQPKQHAIERGVGLLLVGVVLALPEPAPAAPDVPLGQIVEEVHEGPHRLLQIVGVHGLITSAFSRSRALSTQRSRRWGDGAEVAARARVPAVQLGVGDEEGIGVPPRQQHVAQALFDPLLREAQIVRPHHGRIDHVQAKGIGAVGVRAPARGRDNSSAACSSCGRLRPSTRPLTTTLRKELLSNNVVASTIRV
jgi:hypothetical protein